MAALPKKQPGEHLCVAVDNCFPCLILFAPHEA